MKCETCNKSREKIKSIHGEKWYCRRCHNSIFIINDKVYHQPVKPTVKAKKQEVIKKGLAKPINRIFDDNGMLILRNKSF